MFGELLLFVAISLLSYAFYKWATLYNDYFESRKVKYFKPKFLLGNTGGMSFNRYTVVEIAKWLYKTFPDESIVGMFQFRKPQYVVRDPELIKQIAVKDFDHFENHIQFGDLKKDKLWGNTLFFMQSERWRQMRATLSPAFTGNKMRQMFELVGDSADDIAKHFLKKVENGEIINIEMKDFFSKFANDVIASCAYGLKVNSIADPDNEFYHNAKILISFSGLKATLKFLLFTTLPKISNFLKLEFYDMAIANDFKQMILDTMDVRKKDNIYRPDMINILMQLREGKLNHRTDEKVKEQEGFATVDESDVGKTDVNRTWNDDEIVAQCFLFLVAGFQTSSTLLTFAAYELAINPHIQQKLYEEIAETNQQLGGKKISYETLQKMKFLDQVICETLRMWTPGVQNDRTCTKDYEYDDGKLKFKIEKGTTVIFTVYGIHHDPNYFAEPEKFDPERFSDENKGNIINGTYIPFGVGPRNCIGSRFALMEIKAILYYLLLHFSFEPNAKTQIPVKLEKSQFNLLPENGMYLQLKPRKNQMQ